MLQLVRRHPRWLAATAVAVALASALLARAPIGLGNGPLWLPTPSGGWGWSESQAGPVAYVVPIGDAGHGAVVIDGVGVTGRPGFAPSILRHALIGHSAGSRCIGLGAFSSRTSVLAGCVQPLLTSAARAAIPGGTNLGVPGGRKGRAELVLELDGPRPGQCWDITSVVVRYHIGIRHYVATFPAGNAITCGPGRTVPEVA
jgi:hypothetical protein